MGIQQATVAQSMAWWQSLSICRSQQAPANGLLAAGRSLLWCASWNAPAAALHAVHALLRCSHISTAGIAARAFWH